MNLSGILIRKSIQIIILMSLVTLSAQAQTFAPRVNYGALLEQETGVVHGAGQSSGAFENYWDVMDEGEKPAVYMYYIGLSGLNENWYVSLKEELLKRRDYLIIPQIGLSMTSDGNPEQHYEDDVAAGVYDTQIGYLIEGFKKLGAPVYLRIGYEFNGVTWNGYEPESYKAAFVKIAEQIQAANLEVATVWCVAIDGATNYFDYYPGDEVVDWFGVDLFSQSHFSNSNTARFMDSAAVHQKPVLIGESTPRSVGTKAGEASWSGWFVDYFKFVQENPEIKQTNYINWNWGDYPQWSDWGDARIEESGFVEGRYKGELDSAAYIHASSEADFRNRLGYVDDEAPGQVQNFVNLGGENEAILSWDEVTDASGIARYKIYRNDELHDFTLSIPYEDSGLEPLQSYEYKIVAVDRSGVESTASEAITVETSNIIEKISNGGFEEGKEDWDFSTFQGGEGSFLATSLNTIEGDSTGTVFVTNSTGTDWNIQLRQSLTITAGNKYTIKFKAKADKEVDFITVIQQVNDPFSIYNQIQTNLTTTEKSFTSSFTASVTDFVFLSFFLGNIGSSQVWVDSVSVEEEVMAALPEGEKILNGSFDDGINNWAFNLFNAGATADFTVDEVGVFDDQTNGGLIDISSSTDIDWHIQLRQFFEVKKGYAYDISFDALGSQTFTLNLYFQENRDPFGFYSEESFEIGTNPATYTTTFEPDVDDVPAFTFFLGDLGLGQVLFDNVSVKERSLMVSNEEDDELPNKVELLPAYPNPFNPSTNISFTLPEATSVKLVVYDMLGRAVATLLEDSRPQGLNTVRFDASGLSSGVYLVQLISSGAVQNQKITLIK